MHDLWAVAVIGRSDFRPFNHQKLASDEKAVRLMGAQTCLSQRLPQNAETGVLVFVL
jgi:hypothetical protein